VPEGANATLVTRGASGRPLQIGNQPFFGPRLFPGSIDEVQIFGAALSQEDAAHEISVTARCDLRCRPRLLAGVARSWG
jgi:hypothetical protein